MNRPALRSEEWSFDQIGKELVLCIHWEYARESKTIRSHVARFAELREKLRERQATEKKALTGYSGRSKKLRGNFARQLEQLGLFHESQIADFLGQFTTHFPEHFQVDVDELDQ